MKQDKTYQLLVAKMHDVSILPPQTAGPFTGIYKRMVPFFKIYPWKSAFIISTIATILLYLCLGSALVKLASMLQYGF